VARACRRAVSGVVVVACGVVVVACGVVVVACGVVVVACGVVVVGGVVVICRRLPDRARPQDEREKDQKKEAIHRHDS
jgi:Flp pilus assembly protein TadB